MDGKAKRQGWEETLRVMKPGTWSEPPLPPKDHRGCPWRGTTSCAPEPEIRAWVSWGRKTGGQQQQHHSALGGGGLGQLSAQAFEKYRCLNIAPTTLT